MAENEDAIEETPDEPVTDEEGGEVTKKTLSKPLMIKIGIGVIVLLMGAGAAYYFLMPEEVIPELIETEAVEQDSSTKQASTIVEDETIDLGIDASETETISPEDVLDTAAVDNADKVIEEVAETVTYSAEELKKIESDITKMHEDAAALKAENLLLKQQVTELAAKKNAGVDGESTEPVKIPSYELDNNQYIDSYQSDADSYPSRRLPKREATPEPKWGD